MKKAGQLLIDIALPIALLLPVEATKYLLSAWADSQVIYIFVAVPLFICIYYRGLFSGLAGIVFVVACEFLLYERPHMGFFSKGFMAVTGLMLMQTTVVAYYALKWRRLFAGATGLAHRLEAANRYRDLLMGSLGHDLRSPLTVLQSAIYMVKMQGITPNTVKRLENVYRRMKNVTEQVIDMTLLHLGDGLHLHVTEFGLVDVVRRAIEEVQCAFPNVHFVLDTDTPEIIVHLDETRIIRALVNLLTNSCKYGDCTQPITVTVRDKHEFVEVTVHNFGEPIPEDKLQQLFNPFSRSSVKHRTSSMGLGLYITAEMIDKHGGKVHVVSTKEDGTAFTLILPRHAG